MNIRPPGPRYARSLSSLALAALTACVGYEPQPLDGAAVFDAVAASRAAAGAGTEDGVDLATATAWLREHGPAVRDAVAAFRAAKARADVPTPWPDPQIQFGPQTAWGDDVGSTRPVTGFGTLSIPIPLGDRLDAQDDVNRAAAEAQRIDAVLALRSEYLALRGEWSTLATARAREALLAELAAAAARAAETARRLVAAGGASALDAALLELERARAEARRVDAAVTAADAAGALASRTGVAIERFDTLREAGLPEIPAAAPDVDRLRDLSIAHRPELVALRARYAVAERQLRLEVELQYPDLQIGPTYTAEAGEARDQLGLQIGFRIPLFDRNQQAIAAADGERNRIRARYENAARRALAETETLARRVALTSATRRALEESVVPQAEANEELARRTVEAGAVDALRVLDVQRSLRTLRVEVLEARLAELDAWIALERAVGHPLLAFPGEPDAPPEPPAAVAETADATTLRETAVGANRDPNGDDR